MTDHDDVDVFDWVLAAVVLVMSIAGPLCVLFLLIKFIKWAWIAEMMTTPIFFTGAKKQAIRRAPSAVWDEFAYDMLQATAEETGKHINAVTVSRAVVWISDSVENA